MSGIAHMRPAEWSTLRPMSKRAEYFRDQAEKCRAHAERLTNAETQDQLLVLAAEYILRAVKIENEERDRRTLN